MSRLAHLFLATLLITAIAWADGPDPISYQGRLTDELGTPVPDGPYMVTFAIYSGPATALPLWSEVRSILVSQGLFTVGLGDVNPIPDTALSDTAAYLEITVSGDGPLSPRTKLLSVPYSRQATLVDGRGPVQVGAVDPANGYEAEISMAAMDLDPYGRVKMKFPLGFQAPTEQPLRVGIRRPGCGYRIHAEGDPRKPADLD